jgi:hypothetical protein
LSVTNVGASAFKAAGTAVSFATRSLSVTKRGQSGSEASASASANRQQQQQQQRKVPHVVACVSTTSSKTVAAAFFGPPAAGCGSGAAAAGAAAAAGGGSVAAAAAGELASAGVVGSRLFTYELLVPGEIEGSVLVQVANQPLYIKVGCRGRGGLRVGVDSRAPPQHSAWRRSSVHPAETLTRSRTRANALNTMPGRARDAGDL